MYTNEAIAAFKFNTKIIDYNFLYYALDTLDYSKVTDSAIKGVTLNKEKLNNLIINLPPLPQQKKIAKILSTCDAVIEKTEAAIAKYQAIKQGMMHDLFTRGIDLATGKLRPTPQQAPELYKDSELGKIPKEWEVKKLSNLTEVKVSNVDKKIHQGKTLVRLCNYMDVYSNQFITNNMDFMIGSADINEKARFSLKPQDVIITKDSETPEDIAIPSVVIEDLENVVCGYHLAIFSPKQNILNGEFLMYNFMLSSTQRYFFKIASGSTRYGLTIGGIQAATFSIPKFTEQIEIKTRLRIIDDRLSTEEESLKKYQKIKQGLMQDLLTGKVAV